MAGAHFPLNRRQRLTRRLVPLVVAVAAVAVALGWALSGGRSGLPSPTAARATIPTTTAPIPPTTTTATPIPPTTTTDAGSLPQTEAFPSATSPQFLASMSDLFGAVAHGTPATALDAFFPESAYVQLKTVGGPASDWQYRLLAEYDLDIEAATSSLGPDAASATLVSVQVPMEYAHWVDPGECDNSLGYFEVANSRMVYSLDGVVRSFGIASLISWRGEWYVVHLGAILRDGSGGIVLDPAVGTGESAPSTTC